jgi:SAM-dependent methyltransferase
MTSPVVVGAQLEVDPSIASYLQQHGYVDGPDLHVNERLRLELKGLTALRVATSAEVPCEALRGHPRELLSTEDWRRLEALGRSLQLSEEHWRGIGYYFGWKLRNAVGLVQPKRVLSFGSSTGSELVAIKALFPEARLVAIDLNLNIESGWHGPLDIEAAHRAPLEDVAPALAGQFDLIFSNHTLEHLANPEQTLRTLRSLLTPGGVLVSAVPLDWAPGSPAKAAIEALRADLPVHAIEFGDLALAHLWKTSPRDVHDTLARAGFSAIRLFQRVDYPSAWRNHKPMHRTLLNLRGGLGRILNRATVVPARSLLQRVLPRARPTALTSFYLRAEQHLWFGNVQLHNTLVGELAFVAQNPR